MKSITPFHLQIEEIEKASFLEFSRTPLWSPKGLSCDCAGLITLLLKEQNLFPKELIETPKVKDYFEWLASSPEKKTTIQEIDRYDVLAWKKENPPKSGDTGHILLLLRRPKKLGNNEYQVQILEVNRFDGISKRIVHLTTYNDGRLKGIQWHPHNQKVKETTLLAGSLFKRPSCDHCHQVRELCQCSILPKISLKAPPIIILRHPQEKGHALGSVQILEKYFSDLHIEEGEEFKPRQGILLYPHDSHDQLDNPDVSLDKHNPLILIDATWKKSFKIIQKNPWLLELPRFQLKNHSSQYLLRKQKGENYLSSLESFCYSWMELSKNEYAQNHGKRILDIFKDFIEKRKAYYGENVLEEFYNERRSI